MRFIRLVALTAASLFVTLAVADAFVRVSFPELPRFGTNFSAAYVNRVLSRGDLANRVVFLGDSVLWGYRIAPQETATELLRARGHPVTNVSFEGGSIVNTYAMLRLMAARGITPRAVVFNVNLKEFNVADSAYRTLHPALEEAVSPFLAADERTLLKTTRTESFDAAADRRLSRVWMLYGLRSDVRELLFGQADAASAVAALIGEASGRNGREAAAHRPTADRFLGTYDLSPLTSENIEVVFLRKTVALLATAHVPAVAILTPTNHALLHDYIDVPEYDAELTFVRRLLPRPIRVLDLDRAFATSEFLDNDHLTAAGQRRLASMLERVLPR